jgi:hypothetical protein
VSIPYSHIVLDLETYGTAEDAIILSAGLVKLDLNGNLISAENGGELYVVFNVHEQLSMGRTMTDSTQKWWKQQSATARAVFMEPNISVDAGLNQITAFFDAGSTRDIKPLVWGNGPEFDNRLLDNLYAQFGNRTPWTYTQNMSLRVIKAFFPDVVAGIAFEGTRHNALDDARHEAMMISNVILFGDLPNPFRQTPKPGEVVILASDRHRFSSYLGYREDRR